MDLLDRHEFRLVMPGFVELADLARSFLERVIAFADFQDSDAAEILEAASACLGLIEGEVESADDMDVPIEVRAAVDAGNLEIVICEHGIPLDEAWTQQHGHEQYLRASRVFDECRWVQRGAGGTELHLVRKRPHARVDTLVAVEQRITEQHLEETEHTSTADPDGKYAGRVFQPEDAIDVARRIYESYGRSYPNPDLFYPDRIIALNRSGRLRSIVAETSDGMIVGHYAIENPNLGSIGEAGLAVVDAPHRGHGLLTMMNDCLVEEAKRAQLLGLWSQPTTRHPYSQRMNIARGSTPCGLTLGTTPGRVALRGSSETDHDLRYSCFLYWYRLDEEPPISLWVPSEFEEVVRAIYEERGRDVTIETTCTSPSSSKEHSDNEVHARFDRGRKSATIKVGELRSNSLALVRGAVRTLDDIVGADVIYLDLPITDPCCAWMARELGTDGFIFSGIGPRFLGEDSLRLQKLNAPIDVDGLVAEGELGTRIADLVLASFRI